MFQNTLRISLFFLFTLLTLQAEPIESLEPIKTITPEVPNNPHQDTFFFTRGIYYLRFQEESPNELQVYTNFVIIEPGMQGVKYWDDLVVVEQINLNTLDSQIELNVSPLDSGYLQSTTHSVFLDQTQIELDQVYKKTMFRDDVDFREYTRTLRRAKLSPNSAFIGGEVHHESVFGAVSGGAHTRFIEVDTPALWETQSGTLLFPEEINDENHSWQSVFSLESRFSSDGQFFWVRGLDENRSITKVKLEIILLKPIVFLLNLETLETWQADKDVTFTSDSRYFVTERNGLPALIKANTNEVIMNYNPPSPMVSATFSLDDQQLYLACEDDKVYVFPSGNKSHVTNWEEY